VCVCADGQQHNILNTFNYAVSQENDNDVAHYNFNAHKLILAIFGRDIAERNMLLNGDLLSHLS